MDSPVKVALIGGNSRSARAFLELSGRASPAVECLSFVRGPDFAGDEQTVVVPDYSAITPDMLRGYTAVVNFVGAIKAPTESEYMRVNAVLALGLAEAARAAGAAHFIQLSSLSVYGRAQWVDQGTPVAPVTPYGRSKLAAERLLSPLDNAGFRVTLLRIPIIYGRGTRSKLSSLVTLLRRVRLLPAPRPLPRRSIISYRNLVHVLLDLLKFPRGGISFAADPQPLRLDDLLQVLPFRARVIQLPPVLFAPIRGLAPSLYSSLFASMEVSGDCLLSPADPPLVPTAQELGAAFGGEPEPLPHA